MKFIEIRNVTQFAAVDDEDYERIKSLNTDWSILNTPSSKQIISTRALGGKCRHIYLNRFILNVHKESYPLVDHKDRDIFNNKKNNLRLANDSQNRCNAKLRKDNTIGFKGVSRYNKTDTYFCYVNKNGKRHTLTGFITIQEAAIARDSLAKKLHGEFAFQNIKD